MLRPRHRVGGEWERTYLTPANVAIAHRAFPKPSENGVLVGSVFITGGQILIATLLSQCHATLWAGSDRDEHAMLLLRLARVGHMPNSPTVAGAHYTHLSNPCTSDVFSVILAPRWCTQYPNARGR